MLPKYDEINELTIEVLDVNGLFSSRHFHLELFLRYMYMKIPYTYMIAPMRKKCLWHF